MSSHKKRMTAVALTIAVAGAAAAVLFSMYGGGATKERWRTEVEGLLAVPSPCCTDATLWDSLDEVSEDGQRPRPASAAEAALWINTWPYRERGEAGNPDEPPLAVGIKNSEIRCTGAPTGPEVPRTGDDAYTLEAVRLRRECVFTKWRVWAPETAEWRMNERHTVWAEDDGFFRGRVDYWR